MLLSNSTFCGKNTQHLWKIKNSKILIILEMNIINQIINKFFLIRDKLMLELHFKSLWYTYSPRKHSILLTRISWLIVSNAFWRSISIIPGWILDSKQVAIWLFRYETHKSVEKCFLNLDWNLSSFLFESKNSCVWLWIAFSMILDIKESNEIWR